MVEDDRGDLESALMLVEAILIEGLEARACWYCVELQSGHAATIGAPLSDNRKIRKHTFVILSDYTRIIKLLIPFSPLSVLRVFLFILLPATTMGNPETEEPLETYAGRKWYWRVPFTSSKIYPPPSSPTPIPDTTASWISCLTFSWMSTILSQGYARPLHPDDMYDLGGGRSSALYAKRLVDSFERRREDANAFNTRLQAGQVNRKAKRNFLGMKKQQGPETPDELEQRMRKPSLILAMNDAVFWWFWTGGLFRLVADVGTIISPLLVKVCDQSTSLVHYAERTRLNRL